MIVTQEITVDLADPGAVQCVHVKQGDVMSRKIRVKLQKDGKIWITSEQMQAVIRYRIQNSDGQIVGHGMYDTLPDGTAAYQIEENVVTFTPIRELTAQPGLVTLDVLLVAGIRQLATFGFEIRVHPAPWGDVTPPFGDSDENTHYYRVASLEEMNRELESLRNAITALGGGEYLQ